MTESTGAVPSHAKPTSEAVAPRMDPFVFIRPSEWASALAAAYGIPVDHASAILSDVPTADIRAIGLDALAELWERAVDACARFVVDREVAAGMGLGYFRWRRVAGGHRILGGTELAASVGIWQVSRDLAAVGATINDGAPPDDGDLEDDTADGPYY